MLKLVAKSVCARLARALPWGGRRAVLDALLDDFGRRHVLAEIGQQLRVESLTVNGVNGRIRGSIEDDSLLGRYAEEGFWAVETIRMLQEVFEPSGGSFLDIGANIGLTTIPIARNLNVQCHSFEPEPRNFIHLAYNIDTNCEHSNVNLYQLALFDRKDILSLALSDGNSGDHQLRTDGGAAGESDRALISVAVDRLDGVIDLPSLKRPIAVKIDTQGAEPGIFAGGAEILAAADLISLEFWPTSMRRIGGDVELQLRFLQTHFREGTIVRGDSDETAEWKPIDSLVGRLRAHWNDPNIGHRYFDVTVRK